MLNKLRVPGSSSGSTCAFNISINEYEQQWQTTIKSSGTKQPFGKGLLVPFLQRLMKELDGMRSTVAHKRRLSG